MAVELHYARPARADQVCLKRRMGVQDGSGSARALAEPGCSGTGSRRSGITTAHVGCDHASVIDHATRATGRPRPGRSKSDPDPDRPKLPPDGLDPTDLSRLAEQIRAQTVPEQAAEKAAPPTPRPRACTPSHRRWTAWSTVLRRPRPREPQVQLAYLARMRVLHPARQHRASGRTGPTPALFERRHATPGVRPVPPPTVMRQPRHDDHRRRRSTHWQNRSRHRLTVAAERDPPSTPGRYAAWPAMPRCRHHPRRAGISLRNPRPRPPAAGRQRRPQSCRHRPRRRLHLPPLPAPTLLV